MPGMTSDHAWQYHTWHGEGGNLSRRQGQGGEGGETAGGKSHRQYPDSGERAGAGHRTSSGKGHENPDRHRFLQKQIKRLRETERKW